MNADIVEMKEADSGRCNRSIFTRLSYVSISIYPPIRSPRILRAK